MLPIYICDDNPEQLNIIEKYVCDYMMMHHIDDTYRIFSFNSASDFISSYQQSYGTGIYLLDCELNNNIKGPELAKEIRSLDPIGFIIFISAHEKYIPLALRSHINTLDFITKNPDNFQARLYDALDSAFKIYKDYTNRNNGSKEFLFVKIGSKTIPVNYKDILYIESSHKPHKVTLVGLNNRIEFYDNLDNVLTKLNSPDFIRCSRSAIINTKCINHINKANKSIVMDNGKEIFSSSKIIKYLS